MSTHDETPGEPGNELAHESADRLDGTGDMERYVRLHGFIEQLLQDSHLESPADPLPAEDADAYHMAAFLRAAAPGASEPDPNFVANLQTRLVAEINGRSAASAISGSEEALSPSRAGAGKPTRPSRPAKSSVSRRMLLGAGFGAAAAAALGVAAGVEVERLTNPNGPSPLSVDLIPGGSGAWVAVAATDSIPLGQVKRFETDYIVGFIRHTSAGFSALSGTCTHMGCLLLWNDRDHTFDCPCHGGRFTEQGNSAPGSPYTYNPLPPIQTKVENGQVLVYVIPPQQNQSHPTGNDATPPASPYPGKVMP
jgi:cytochrome b6-f complex iron-sulfur subunit